MKTIWKFDLSIATEQAIDMPVGAEILDLQIQGPGGGLKVWALVDPDAEVAPRRFYIFGTGHYVEVEETAKYVGTVQVYGGSLVWHIFDAGEDE